MNVVTIEFYGGPLDGTSRDLDYGPADEIRVNLIIPNPAGGGDVQHVGVYQRVRPGLTYVWSALKVEATP